MVTCPTCGQPLAFMYWQGVKVSHCFNCQPCYQPFCVTKYELGDYGTIERKNERE